MLRGRVGGVGLEASMFIMWIWRNSCLLVIDEQAR